MNKIKQLAGKISDNRATILKRTLVIGIGVVAVTLTAGLLKDKSADTVVEVVEVIDL